MTEPQHKAPAMPRIQTPKHLAFLIAESDPVDALDGSDPTADNVTRAALAASAVQTFAKLTGQFEGEPLDQVISDLLCDLMHLLDVLAESGEDGTEFPSLEGLIDRGSRHYEAEIRGEF